MSDPFDPKEYIQNSPPGAGSVADQFAESIINVEDLPEEKRKEYEAYQAEEASVAPDNKEAEHLVEELLETMDAIEKVEITDEMRQSFMEAVLSNGRYEWSYEIYEDKMTIIFHTLLVKEYDAIADAVAQVSQESGFINQGHLRFVNFRYTVSAAISEIKTTDEEGGIQIFKYGSPLTESTATHREEELEIKQLDGSIKKKTVTKEITDGDRILEAHKHRFSEVNATLYNIILNTYAKFDREVNAIAAELHSKNFTAPIKTS